MTNTTQVIKTGYFLMGCASICSSDIPTPVLLLEALLLEELLDPLDLQVLDFFPLASFFFFSVFDPFLVLLLPLLLAFLSLLCFFLDLSFFLQAWCKDHSNGCSGVQLARSCGHNCSSLCTQIQHMNQYNTNAIIPLSVLEPTIWLFGFFPLGLLFCANALLPKLFSNFSLVLAPGIAAAKSSNLWG